MVDFRAIASVQENTTSCTMSLPAKPDTKWPNIRTSTLNFIQIKDQRAGKCRGRLYVSMLMLVSTVIASR